MYQSAWIRSCLFFVSTRIRMASLFKKTGVKLEVLKDSAMLLMVEKGIKGGICHSVHTHAKANNKYMKNYDKNKKSSYLIHMDVNNLYG